MVAPSLEYCPLCGRSLGNYSLADHLTPTEIGGNCSEREAFSAELGRRAKRRKARARAEA